MSLAMVRAMQNIAFESATKSIASGPRKSYRPRFNHSHINRRPRYCGGQQQAARRPW